ncbi:UNVERIFIED_CONTAM: hypothetical protein K2H54_050970 [Gekko kuhli]
MTTAAGLRRLSSPSRPSFKCAQNPFSFLASFCATQNKDPPDSQGNCRADLTSLKGREAGIRKAVDLKVPAVGTPSALILQGGVRNNQDSTLFLPSQYKTKASHID